MKIAITGATGFTGSHLSKALLADGHQVIGIRRASSDTSFTPVKEWIVADNNLASLTQQLVKAKPDVVIHLASLFIAEHQAKDVAPLIESNIMFPALLLDAMAQVGCTRLINTGTTWQHFDDQEYNPVSLYAATKEAFEDLCRFYAEARGFKIVHLHLSDSYGPEDRRGKLVSTLLRLSRSGEHLGLSPGEQQIDLVHVRDIVEAYRKTLTLLSDITAPPDITAPQTYAISSSAPLSLRELVSLVEKQTGGKLNIGWGERAYRAREMMKASRRLMPVPGWAPKVKLADGLKELHDD